MKKTHNRHIRSEVFPTVAVWLFTAGVAIASSDRQVELDKKLFCKPTLNYFCGNIHIGCAGQSNIGTWPFELIAEGDTGRMISPESTTRLVGSVWEGMVIPQDGNKSLLLFLNPERDYVKVSSTGRFNFRLYTKHGALMTYGWSVSYTHLTLPTKA